MQAKGLEEQLLSNWQTSFPPLFWLLEKNRTARNCQLISKSNAAVKILVLAIDLLETDAADGVVSRTLEEFGQIHAVVNIAGAVTAVRPIHHDREPMGCWIWPQVARSTKADGKSLGLTEKNTWLCYFHVRKLGADAENWLCRGCHRQCRDRSLQQSNGRARNSGWNPSQHRTTGAGLDG